jgi:hypothetical protein
MAEEVEAKTLSKALRMEKDDGNHRIPQPRRDAVLHLLPYIRGDEDDGSCEHAEEVVGEDTCH